jgi:hypothetical protein
MREAVGVWRSMGVVSGVGGGVFIRYDYNNHVRW